MEGTLDPGLICRCSASMSCMKRIKHALKVRRSTRRFKSVERNPDMISHYLCEILSVNTLPCHAMYA